jgi:hypothetical protein
MRLTRLVALVATVGCIASVSLSSRTEALATSRGQDAGVQQPILRTSSLGISGTVVRVDRTTPVAGVRLRLRNLDTGTIVGQTVSAGNGTFSFAAPEPGLYLVEALEDDGGVRAVSEPVALTNSPAITTVVLPAVKEGIAFSTAAALLLAAGSIAGIAIVVPGTPDVVSPER